MDEEAGRTDSIAGAPTGSTVRCGCGQARIQQLSPGQLHLHGFESFFSATTKKPLSVRIAVFSWWGRTDSNHRSETQQIYSLSPLATRELPHIQFLFSDWSR